jgi:hypothetical protein
VLSNEYVRIVAGLKGRIRKSVDIALKGSLTYEEFLLRLTISGYETKQNQGILFRKIGQQRFVKGRSLGSLYTLQRIKRSFLQKQTPENQLQISDRLPALIDLDTNLKALQNKGYARSINIKNLKATAKSLLFLEEQRIFSYSSLQTKYEEVKAEFERTMETIKQLEGRISELTEVAKKVRIVVDIENNSLSYSKVKTPQMLALKDACIKALKESGIESPYPNNHALAEELENLVVKKDHLYQQYKKTKTDWNKFHTAKQNVDILLSMSKNAVAYQIL